MLRIALATIFLACSSWLFAHDAKLPAGFVLEEFIVDGLEQPTDLKFAPDGRIFIAEKGGSIRIVENGILLDQPFYTVATQTPNERGLIGMVLDPQFEANGYLYLMYALPVANQNIVARVTSAGNTAIPGSEVELIRFNEMWAAFHNGGGMAFAPDGTLIVGTGDGTGFTSAQELDNTLGKILRINPDGSIPTDNPYYNENTGAARAIVSYGVRNPYTMAVSKVSGRIFFNDVGNIDYEEINEFEIGMNYGWYQVEGVLNGTSPDDNYRDPLYAYDHEEGRCAIVGSSFYEPETSNFPAGYNGKYFFMDLCIGTISYMDPNSYEVTQFASGLREAYNNLEVSPDGYLYLVNVIEGNLARISYVGVDAPPIISEHPSSWVAAVNESPSFYVEATGEELDYLWYQNGNLLQASGNPFITLENVQLSDDNSTIYVTVRNDNGSVTSNIASLRVVNGSRPNIQFQNVPATYMGGDTIPFTATVTDPDQQRVLPPSLTWEVKFHHDDHEHPALPPTTGVAAGEYVVETFGEVDTNVFYRIHLTVEDSSGLISTDFIDVLPEKATLVVASQPEGVDINIDGVNVTTNYPQRSVKNLSRTIEVPPYAVVGDSLYQFWQWEDGQDTMIRVFSAFDDTVSVLYQAIEAYYHTIPSVGNLTYFTDTGSVRQFYAAEEVQQIKKNWDVQAPFVHVTPVFPEDYFSVQWTGTISPPVTGLYTFYLYHDAKVSLYLGDTTLLDGVVAATDLQEDTIQVWLEGGKHLDLRLEYDHYEHIARVELDWQFSIVDRQSVWFEKDYPQENLDLDEDGIMLFPNPTHEPIIYVYIDPEIYADQRISLQIFDSQGKQYDNHVADLEDGIYPMSVSQLSQGMYYVRIGYGVQTKVVKFIKR